MCVTFPIEPKIHWRIWTQTVHQIHLYDIGYEMFWWNSEYCVLFSIAKFVTGTSVWWIQFVLSLIKIEKKNLFHPTLILFQYKKDTLLSINWPKHEIIIGIFEIITYYVSWALAHKSVSD